MTTNREKGDYLEDTLRALILPAFATDNHIIQQFALSRKDSNPDIWVQDSKGREWLVECKNEAHHNYEPGRKWSRKHKRWMQYSNNIEWLHDLGWTKSHILNKNWTSPKYFVRSASGITSRTEIEVHDARKLLITSFLDFDVEALSELNKMFGQNILVVERDFEQLGLPPEAFFYLWEKLRDVFTSGDRA